MSKVVVWLEQDMLDHLVYFQPDELIRLISTASEQLTIVADTKNLIKERHDDLSEQQLFLASIQSFVRDRQKYTAADAKYSMISSKWSDFNCLLFASRLGLTKLIELYLDGSKKFDVKKIFSKTVLV